MEELLLINPEQATDEEVAMYSLREAARAIVKDEQGKVALLHVTKKNYYKLPGGGIEEDEERGEALKRECLEEIGCEIDIVAEIGSTIEYRKMYGVRQISYCYFATLKGSKGVPTLDDGEIADGFKEVWLPYEEALQAMEESAASDYEGAKYIVPRDTHLLKEAGKYIR